MVRKFLFLSIIFSGFFAEVFGTEVISRMPKKEEKDGTVIYNAPAPQTMSREEQNEKCMCDTAGCLCATGCCLVIANEFCNKLCMSGLAELCTGNHGQIDLSDIFSSFK